MKVHDLIIWSFVLAISSLKGTICENEQLDCAGEACKTDRHHGKDKYSGNGRHLNRKYQDGLAVKAITREGKELKVVELSHHLASSHVRAFIIDDFLSESECTGLARAHDSHIIKYADEQALFCFESLSTFEKYLQEAGLTRESVSESDFTAGTLCINETFSTRIGPHLKWSFSTSFYRGESRFSEIYERRLFEATALRASHGGKFQVTSYPAGIGYRDHTDCTIGVHELRDRFATALVYLTDVQEGGETVFHQLGIKVTPRRGRLLVWNSMDSRGVCDPTSVHQAAPVKAGRKIIIQRWYYYESFSTLGLRVTEPSLPVRKPYTARISCDRFEEGSCRWYDEWGHDHLLEYRFATKM